MSLWERAPTTVRMTKSRAIDEDDVCDFVAVVMVFAALCCDVAVSVILFGWNESGIVRRVLWLCVCLFDSDHGIVV